MMNYKMCCTDQNSFKSENRINVSDELDYVPLIRRRSILLAKKQHLSSADCNFEPDASENGGREKLNESRFDGVVKEEEESTDVPVNSLYPLCCTKEEEVQVLGQRTDHASADPGPIVPDLLHDHCLQNGTCSQNWESFGESHGHINVNNCSESINTEPKDNKVSLEQKCMLMLYPKIKHLQRFL